MEAVCILLKVDPIKFKSKDGIGYNKDYWAAATSKHVLGNPKLQEHLIQFDHTNLDGVNFDFFIKIFFRMLWDN